MHTQTASSICDLNKQKAQLAWSTALAQFFICLCFSFPFIFLSCFFLLLFWRKSVKRNGKSNDEKRLIEQKAHWKFSQPKIDKTLKMNSQTAAFLWFVVWRARYRCWFTVGIWYDTTPYNDTMHAEQCVQLSRVCWHFLWAFTNKFFFAKRTVLKRKISKFRVRDRLFHLAIFSEFKITSCSMSRLQEWGQKLNENETNGGLNKLHLNGCVRSRSLPLVAVNSY